MASNAEQITSLTEELMAPRSAAQRQADRLERRSYAQGMTKEQRDLQDGARDAERVIVGLEPLRGLQEDVTPAYRQGWMGAVEMLLEAFPGSEIVAEAS
jgi:hypothetical protein